MNTQRPMCLGLDFDNTIACYDQVFSELAKAWQLVPETFQGAKQQLREALQRLPEGDTVWQRLQGQVYGAYMHQAVCFSGLKAFLKRCQERGIRVFIVSHKTEFGHFDAANINLRDAAQRWLYQEQLIGAATSPIPENHVFFETTREEKIARIEELSCTHFIDDLLEVFTAPTFPETIQKIWFNPNNLSEATQTPFLTHYPDWISIQHALFE
jgi:hypothetical protein